MYFRTNIFCPEFGSFDSLLVAMTLLLEKWQKTDADTRYVTLRYVTTRKGKKQDLTIIESKLLSSLILTANQSGQMNGKILRRVQAHSVGKKMQEFTYWRKKGRTRKSGCIITEELLECGPLQRLRPDAERGASTSCSQMGL